MKTPASLVFAVCALLASTAVIALPQGSGGLLQGFAHPFVLGLLLGALLGLGEVQLPAAELLIAASVLVFSFALAASARIGLGLGLVIATRAPAFQP